MRRLIVMPALLVLFALACWALLKSAGLDSTDAPYYAAVAALGLVVACFGFTLRHGGAEVSR